MQEAHKEYSSLTDQIRAKYEQLDSGEFGSPGTPAFDAEACELANLLALVSQLCQRLNLHARNCTGPHSSSIEDTFRIKTTGRQSWLGYGGCSFVPMICKNYRVAEHPLVLRIGDWLCVLPAITL